MMGARFKSDPPQRAFARSTDPQTSHDAARSVEPDLTNLEVTVLIAIPFEPENAILDEVIEATGIEKVSVAPRFKPLEQKGVIFRTGKRRGFAGRLQTSWSRKTREVV